MRERRFSARAEQMLRSAQAAALELGHGYVGCEHLLLAMLREEEDAPGRALRASGVEEEKTRALITRAVGRGEADLAPVSYTHLDVYKRQRCPTLHFWGGAAAR